MRKATEQSEIVDALSLQDLCRFCRSDQAWVVELVEHGVLEPDGASVESWHFHGISIARAKRAGRLRRDLGINAAGVALVLELLEERDAMMRKLAQYAQD